MTHILIQPGSLARPQSAATAAIGRFVRHLDKTKERMLRSRYLGAGRLAMVDKYYNLSYQKTIIIIIFLTRPTAWSPLSVHQAKTPSIVPFYNMPPCVLMCAPSNSTRSLLVRILRWGRRVMGGRTPLSVVCWKESGRGVGFSRISIMVEWMII